MNGLRTGIFVAGVTAAALGAPGADAQNDMAAERARIANERIRRDMELRTREEPAPTSSAPTPAAQTSLPLAATRPAPVAAAPAVRPGVNQGLAPTAVAGGAPASAAAGDYTETLEQLRVLGQLRDAGYLTDDEFTRIKTRIIASVF